MVTRSRVQMKGLRELGEAMRALSGDVQVKVGRSAVGSGANIIKKQAKKNAPVADEPYQVEGVTVQPGNVPKNIITKRVKPGEAEATVEYVVAVRGKRKYGYASRIGALNEFGTVNMPAQPFLRPAFEQKKVEAAQKIASTLKTRIDKANQGK